MLFSAGSLLNDSEDDEDGRWGNFALRPSKTLSFPNIGTAPANFCHSKKENIEVEMEEIRNAS